MLFERYWETKSHIFHFLCVEGLCLLPQKAFKLLVQLWLGYIAIVRQVRVFKQDDVGLTTVDLFEI